MKKSIKVYGILSLIICIFIMIIYAWKGVFPFGENSVIWADMHNQITAFYYHLYDGIRGSSSIFIDFSTSGGINFFGIMAYYLVSPFSLIILLFERANIYQAVSIIVGLKFLLSGITCLYFIRKYFKKLPDYMAVFLSLLYAFCGYNLIMYQITPWMDVVYLFPLLMIGLKKLLDLEKPILYIVIFTTSIICCFYLSLLVLIFIAVTSYIYLHYFSAKENRRKVVMSLGISTVLSLLMSMFIIFPTMKEIMVSSRIGIDFTSIFASNVGPVGDKVSFFFPCGFLLIMLIFGYKDLYRNEKHKPFLKYLFITILLLALPVLVEPINRMLHMGSYVCFPYRYGFIPIFFLIIGVAYCYNYITDENVKVKPSLWISLFVLGVSITNVVITFVNLELFQRNVESLTISYSRFTYGLMSVMCLLGMLVAIFIVRKYSKNHKLLFMNIIILGVVSTLTNMVIYLGMDFKMDELMDNYTKMNALSVTREKDEIYRIKNLYAPLVRNFGMVSGYHTFDHFTSFTAKANMDTQKRIGYSSLWMDTSSEGGTIFTDLLLASKYLLSGEKYESKYYNYKAQVDSLNLYESNLPISYGYLVHHNTDVVGSENGFVAMNKIYHTITDENDDLFDIYNDFAYENIKLVFRNNRVQYRSVDGKMRAYITGSIKVDKESILYLDILRSLDNGENIDIRYKMKISVNDEVLKEEFTTKNQNGILNLGTFKNEVVDIKIELLGNIELSTLEVGILETSKLEDFADTYKLDTNVLFNKNNVHIKLNSDESGILFIPIVYDTGYTASNNGNNTEVIKLFDNYIGIYVKEGFNDIKLTYMPPGLKMGAYISIGALFIVVGLFLFKLYDKIISIKWINYIIYNIYAFIFIGAILGLYVIPFFYFVYTILGGRV